MGQAPGDASNQIDEGKRIAERLRREALSVQRTWALWEALNGNSKADRRDLREALSHLGLSGQAEALQGTLVRDGLLTLYRMTDHALDAFSLCAIARLLWDDELCAYLSGRTWFQKSGYQEFLIESEISEQPIRIQSVRSLVSRRWNKECPRDPKLYCLRERLIDVRNKVLAHPLDADGIIQPRVDEVREFLRITTNLVEQTELVFLGAAHATMQHFDVRMKEAATLWGYFEEGPICAHQADIEKRREAGLTRSSRF